MANIGNIQQAFDNPIFVNQGFYIYFQFDPKKNLVDLGIGREMELSQRNNPNGNHVGGRNEQFIFFRWIQQNFREAHWRRAYTGLSIFIIPQLY